MSRPINRHAGPPTAPGADAPAEPSPAERASTLVHLGRTGMLATLSRRHPGHPFGSVMPYALDEARRPLFLISSMAMHTQNLEADGRASLLVTGPGAAEDPLASGRVTLIGEAGRIPAADVPAAREHYLARHPRAAAWVDFGDFAFWRLEVVDLYWVGGFAAMDWVEARAYGGRWPRPALRGGAGHRRAHEPRSRRCAGALRSRARGRGGRRGDHARGGPPGLQAPARERRAPAHHPHRLPPRGANRRRRAGRPDRDGQRVPSARSSVALTNARRRALPRIGWGFMMRPASGGWSATTDESKARGGGHAAHEDRSMGDHRGAGRVDARAVGRRRAEEDARRRPQPGSGHPRPDAVAHVRRAHRLRADVREALRHRRGSQDLPAARRRAAGLLRRRQDGDDQAAAGGQVQRRHADERRGGAVLPRPPPAHEGLQPAQRDRPHHGDRGRRPPHGAAQAEGAVRPARRDARRPRGHAGVAGPGEQARREVRNRAGLRRAVELRRARAPGPHRAREVRALLRPRPGAVRQAHLPHHSRRQCPARQPALRRHRLHAAGRAHRLGRA